MKLIQEYKGRISYVTQHQEGPHRLLVSAACRVGDLGMLVRALLDTGSEWCVLATDVAASLGCDLTQGELPLHTRFGTIWGSLGRLPLRFESAEGQSLELEATWFISADWPGPTVIGWKGGLERLRFALNPGDDTFYFGEL